MGSSAKSVEQVVEEIMRIHRSLPPRPGIDEVEAANILIRNVDNDDQSRLDAISRQKKRVDVLEELFSCLQEMQKNMVYFQSKEQKREALKVLDLENCYQSFDDLIQRASKCVPSSSQSGASTSGNSSCLSLANSASFSNSSFNSPGALTTTSSSSLYLDKEPAVKASELFTRDDSYVKKVKPTFYGDGIGIGLRSVEMSTPQIVDSTLKPAIASGEFDCYCIQRLSIRFLNLLFNFMFLR